jgi:hypothetical protein
LKVPTRPPTASSSGTEAKATGEMLGGLFSVAVVSTVVVTIVVELVELVLVVDDLYAGQSQLDMFPFEKQILTLWRYL